MNSWSNQKKTQLAWSTATNENTTSNKLDHSVINLDDANVKDGTRKDNLSIVQYIEDFGNDTTHHGVRYVTTYKYNAFRRLLWAAILLVADMYLLFQIVAGCTRYYSRPVNTLVSVKYETGDMDFPAVTLCNYNQWMKSMSTEEELTFLSSFFGTGSSNSASAPGNWSEFDDVFDIDYDNLLAHILNSTHRIKDMVLSCTWRGGTPCDWRNFTTVLTDWGVCYTFNNPEDASDILKINQPGMNSGLFLRLDVQQDEYVASEQTAAGFKVLLHKQGVHPILKEQGFAVSPGFETLVTINYETVTNLPFTDCFEDIQEKPLFSKKYTVPLCNLACKVDYVVENCGCRDYRYPGNATVCSPLEMVYCTYIYEDKFFSEHIKCDCPVPCYSEKYGATISNAYFPNENVVSRLGKSENVTEDWIRRNYLDLRIFFEELSYTSVEQTEAYTSDDLISDIGGNMGLMAGMSLITILEAFDCIANTIWKKFCRNR